MADGYEVKHNEVQDRFEVQLDGALAKLEYSQTGNTIVFSHTEVPTALEGKGIGGALAQTALDYARARDLQVVPLCPFVRGYIDRHTEYKSLVKQESGGGWG